MVEETLREFKDRQYKYVRDNIKDHRLNSLTGWIDLVKNDVQTIRNRKKRY